MTAFVGDIKVARYRYIKYPLNIREAGTRFYAACHSINEERNALRSSADRGTDVLRINL